MCTRRHGRARGLWRNAAHRAGIVHRWRHLVDLERFRQDTGRRQDQRMAELGATLERFTGVLVAQYPLDEATPS